jgi:hypothetical protein
MSSITERSCVAAAALALLALAGCASVQRDVGFPAVRDAVGKRLESNVAWNQDSEQDHRARAAVRRCCNRN